VIKCRFKYSKECTLFSETSLSLFAQLLFLVKKQVQPLVPFLSLIKPEKLSLITILEIMRLQGTGGVADGMKTARGLVSVGKAVELEYKAQMCKKNNISVPSRSIMPAGESGFFSRYSYHNLHARRVTAWKYMEDAEEWTSDWTQVLRVRVGSFLIDRLMDVAKVIRTGTNRRTGELSRRTARIQPHL